MCVAVMSILAAAVAALLETMVPGDVDYSTEF